MSTPSPEAEPAEVSGLTATGRRAKPPIKLPAGFEGDTVQESIRIALKKSNASPLDLYKQWDKDGSGGIDKHEFTRGLHVLGVKGTDHDFHALFEAWDTDGGGTLDRQEIDKALKNEQKLDEVASASVTAKQAGKANVKNDSGFFSLKPKAKPRPVMKSDEEQPLDKMPDFAEKIHKAARANDLKEIVALRAAHKDNIRKLVEASDFHGATPLMKAAMYGSTGALDELLSDGASMIAVDGYGRTALMLASINGELGVLRALLRHGADLSATDKRYGRNSIMWAILGSHPEAVGILAETYPVMLPDDPFSFLSAMDVDMKTCRMLAEEALASAQAHNSSIAKVVKDAVIVLQRITTIEEQRERS